MHSFTHAYMPTNISACLHAYIQTYQHTYIHTYMPTCLHAYTPTCIHAYQHTNIPTCIHTSLPTHPSTYLYNSVGEAEVLFVVDVVQDEGPELLEPRVVGRVVDATAVPDLGRPGAGKRLFRTRQIFVNLLRRQDIGCS